MTRSSTRRQFLHLLVLGSGTALMAACTPAAPPAPTAAPAKPVAPAPTSAPAAPAAQAATAKPAAQTAPAQTNSAYEQLLAAAKQEGELSISSVDISSEAIGTAFNARVGTDIKLTTVNIAAAEIVARLVAGAQAGKLETDFAQVGAVTMLAIENEKLLEEYDWVGTFGKEFPQISQAAERVNPRFQGGKALDLFHSAYIIGYNKGKISEAELPKTLEALADPQYNGKFAIDPRGTPYQLFAPFWGEAKMLDVAGRIGKNQPTYVRGGVGIADAIGRGEVSFGITTAQAVELRKPENPNIEWFAPAEVPMSAEMLATLKGNPHPNAARLFAAWLTTEGRTVMEKEQRTGVVWPDAGSYLGQRLKDFGSKIVTAETPEHLLTQQEAGKLVEAAYKG